MKLRNRFGVAAAGAVIAVAGLLGLTACGPAAAEAAVLSPEASALNALGFSTDDLVPVANPSPSGDSNGQHPNARRRLIRDRVLMRRNMLHGEAVVKTKDGDKTVEVQRGTVTAIDDRTVTVKSSDGFTMTWTFGSPIRVVEHRTTVQPSSVKVGEEIGVAGTKDGDTNTAKLILIPVQK
ncbi:MAG TPA: hypothetical protein VF054_05920 [Micromonosporaceae bacterium]